MDEKILAAARNIVNQLADLWEVPVTVRQTTNDQCDEFVAGIVRELVNKDDLMQRFTEQLTKDGKPMGMMQCNRCGYVEAHQPTDVTPEEFQAESKATIMRMKEHFANKGWQTGWGYDLCPECAQEYGKTTSDEPLREN